MNCPSPGVTVTETIHAGVTRIPVSWTEPTATDRYNQLITNIMKTHQPGDSFNVGESIAVIYTFIDDISGLQDTCTFIVTVNRKDIIKTSSKLQIVQKRHCSHSDILRYIFLGLHIHPEVAGSNLK